VFTAAIVVEERGAEDAEGAELAEHLLGAVEWSRVEAVEPWAEPRAYAQAVLPHLAWLPNPILRLAVRLHAALAGCTGAAVLEASGAAVLLLAFRPWRLELRAQRGRVRLVVDELRAVALVEQQHP